MHEIWAYGKNTVLTIINWHGRNVTDVNEPIDAHSAILSFLSVYITNNYLHKCAIARRKKKDAGPEYLLEVSRYHCVVDSRETLRRNQ